MIKTAAVIALLAVNTGAMAQTPMPVSSASFEQVNADVGCSSVYSDAKKDDLWKNNYNNHWVTWSGTVSDIERDGNVGIKITALVEDALIGMSDDTYNLTQGAHVTIRFLLTSQAGCLLPYFGEQGHFVSDAAQN